MSATTQTHATKTARKGGWPPQPKRPRAKRELIRLRIIAGLSPNELAERAGISGASVRSAEAGRRVSMFVQRSICSTLTTELAAFGLGPVMTIDIWPLEDHL